MYGLLIESIVDYIRKEFGDEVWEEVRQKGDFHHSSFSTHERYSETLVPAIAQTASHVTGKDIDTLMDAFGVAFVSFVSQYGYDRILKVLGRHMRDFLNGLDNLHEYLRFSYPKMKAPSFFCEHENKTGLTLHYRSRRKGFLHYVKGQIRQVGKLFYNTKVDIFVITEENIDGMMHVVFRLVFDNTAYRDVDFFKADGVVDNIPLRSDLLFDLFPFHIVFSRYLDIRNVGHGLGAVMPKIFGKQMTKVFTLRRPLVSFTWETILAHTNNVFELRSMRPVKRILKTKESTPEEPEVEENSPDSDEEKHDSAGEKSVQSSFDIDSVQECNCLSLKGQMMYMFEWDSIMFLGTPVMESLDDMFNAGLYINDLSMHDSSRDLVLAGTQQSAELKLALDQEQEKSRLLEESMMKLDKEMKRTDALLYQMIPKPVADRLRRGEPSVSTCEVFENVTILFSDVVGFTTICSQITPMEVVSMLNAMYTKFDKLSEQHRAYKVETIGDAYMVVSGAPTVTKFHALQICDMALDMLDSMWDLKDPSTGGNMKIRVGIHTGMTVAGVVGIKMPRYCLFGDTVNTASRMETNGQAMKIHVSETTRAELQSYPYEVEERGNMQIKGKGLLKTYWLLGKKERNSENIPKCPFSALLEEEMKKINTESNGCLGDSVNAKIETRTLYSPVSFDDIPVSKGSRTSPDGTPLSHNTPLKYPTPRKQNNKLNNNDPTKTAAIVQSEEKVPPKKEITKEVKDSPAKQRDVGMIKNTLHPLQRPAGTSVVLKKEESEKPKSQTCQIV